MSVKPRWNELSWLAGGAGILVGVALAALHYHGDRERVTTQAAHARALAICDGMRIDLASSGEAEKSAVLAITDEDSRAFAERARAARAAVARGHDELASLFGPAPQPSAVSEGLERFERSFTELGKIDEEVLDLAVRNTNLKATALANGPAAAALDELESALEPLATRAPSTTEAVQGLRLADDARIRALRVAVLLPRHIAEESDARMDELEARIEEEGQALRTDLAALAPLRTDATAKSLDAATEAWSRFTAIQHTIVSLSRENTNVRSLSLSLTRKRNAMSVSQDALTALRQAVDGAFGGAAGSRPTPVSPR